MNAPENWDRLIFAGIAASFFSVTFSVTLCEGGLGLAAAAMTAKYFAANVRPQFSALAGPVLRVICAAWLFYLLAGALSASFAIDAGRSFSALGSDVVKCLAFAVLLLSCDKKLVARARPYYVAGACISALWGLVQLIATSGPDGLGRASGSLSAVTYCEVLSLSAIAAFAAFFHSSGRSRFLYGLSAALLSAGVLAGQGRASMGALFAALVIMLFCAGRGRRGVFAVALAVLMLAGGIFATRSQRMKSVPVFVAGLYKTVVLGEQVSLDQNISGWDRLEMWRAGAAICRDYPLLGIGPANIRNAFDFYHPQPLSGAQGDEFGLANVHNLFIQQAAERGLLGLAALLSLLWAMFYASVRWFRSVADENTLWFLAAFPAFLLMNLTETTMQHALPAFSIFFALAAARASADGSNVIIDSPKTASEGV